MAIEISSNRTQGSREAADAGKSQATAASAKQPKSTAAGSNSSGADKLNLSAQAAQLQALEAEIANLPVVDAHRVEDVQQTLATGSYEIQPAQVADKVLTFEASLGKS